VEPFRGVILGEGIQHRLDLRGAIIPFSLLKVSQVFKIIKPGELIEILYSDPDIRNDLLKILPESSYELTLMEELEEDYFYRIQLKKSFKQGESKAARKADVEGRRI
jgi:TusA-related sulfurtransferase